MRFMKQLLLATILALIIGCEAPGGQPPSVVNPANPHLHKVAYSGRYLVVEHIQLLKKQSSGLLQLNVSFFNRRPSGTPYRYQVHWLDHNGAVLSSADRGWRSLTMIRGSNPLLLVAKNTRAVDFKLTIEKD
jgi:hypothetical protein